MPREDVFHPCSWPCDWKSVSLGLNAKVCTTWSWGHKGGGDGGKILKYSSSSFALFFLIDINDQTGAGQRPWTAVAELGTFPTQVPAQKLGQAARTEEEGCEEGVHAIPSIATREQGMLGKPYYIFPGNQFIMWIRWSIHLLRYITAVICIATKNRPSPSEPELLQFSSPIRAITKKKTPQYCTSPFVLLV